MDRMPETRILAIHHPADIVFGTGSRWQLVQRLSIDRPRQVFVVAARPLRPFVDVFAEAMAGKEIDVDVWDSVVGEPDIGTFEEASQACRAVRPDLVIGIGGGSVLDVAKLVAALYDSDRNLRDAFGIGNLKRRQTRLVCMPTTSGTGSEASPNAILLDEDSKLKRAVVSPHLVADSAYVDPELTLTVPPEVTAYTGMDAITHCIEAYANVNAHPMIDLFALEGMRLIAANLRTACEDGANLAAREAMALGSLYGGLCLGPVNTGAVHALAYPLGGEFHVAHGLSNAVLLPHVLEYNIPAMPDRYAQVARALGAEGGPQKELARRGVGRIRELMTDCRLPLTLSQLVIPREAIPAMAESAMTVTRLLRNNPRTLTIHDARSIYEKAY